MEESKKNLRIARIGQELNSEPPPNAGENTYISPTDAGESQTTHTYQTKNKTICAKN
jgi:hypothetical protein